MSLSASSEERVERSKRRVDELPDYKLPHPDRHPKKRNGKRQVRDWPRRHRDDRNNPWGLDDRYAMHMPRRSSALRARLALL